MNLSKIAQQLGRRGGKKSAESRFKGKTKEQISETMRKIRYSKSDLKDIKTMRKAALKAARAISPHQD